MNGISFELPRLLLPLGLQFFGVSLMATPILCYQEVQQAFPSSLTRAFMRSSLRQATMADHPRLECPTTPT